MKIQFTDERINEYYEGGIHELNDGEPFDVSDIQGEEMLKKIHFLDGQQVPVFERVVDKEPDETAEHLAKNKREDLEKMARDLGLDGESYPNKPELAQAIVVARDAKDETETDETEG